MPNASPLTHDEFHLWNDREFKEHAVVDDKRYEELRLEVRMVAANLQQLLTQLRTSLIALGVLGSVITGLAGVVWLDRDQILKATVLSVYEVKQQQALLIQSQHTVGLVLDKLEDRDKVVLEWILKKERNERANK